MSSGCGCGSYTPINRIINATVCQNYFIIIDVACSNPTNISTPEFGTAEVYGPGQIIYTHSDSLYTSETDSFTFRCNGVTYTVNLVIEQTIPPTTTIVTFSASGSCEVGNPTYTWTIPDCATLVEGYNIHDQTVQVIVPMFDPENPTAVCVLTVDVCCDYCHNCCKCETIEWYPPNCTLECGEDPDCNCNHLPCHTYDPISGNCIPTCEVDEVCCEIEGTNIVLSMECDQIDSQHYTFEITSDTYDINARWLLSSLLDATSTPSCLQINNSVWITGKYSIILDSGSFTIVPNNPTSLTIDFKSDGVPGDGTFFIGLLTSNCTVHYAFQVLVSAQLEENLCDGGIEFNPYYYVGNTNYEPNYPICNACTYDSSFCAECCTTDDCYIAGCPNTNMICYNNSCYCILNDGSYIPAPTDGTCCPNCTDDTVPECYECIDGTVVPPDDCPIGQVYDWDTCTCTGTPCSEFNCLNPESPTYCPEQPGCGCIDVPNSTVDVCVPCNTVSCTANPDCPLGCYCDDGTCQENPCFSFDCVNTNPNVYCPTQDEGCFCDEIECLPCNSVSCTGDIDCPFGCICDENIQTCIGNPCATYQCENPSAVTYCPPQVDCGCDEINNCIPCNTVSCTATVDCPEGCACIDGTCDGPCGTLEINCDAYFVHNENDLTLTNTCVNGANGYYLIEPHLGLEPGFVPTLGNTTYWVNLSNYVGGWYEITGSVVISGVTAIQKVGGNLKIYYAANINYLSIMIEMAGRKIWYRLNGVTDEGVGCPYSELELGGAFLCGEIFTIESNSGIDWSVDQWFVSPSSGITYSSTGPNGVLIIECAGTELITLSAEVSTPDCTISTCPTAYQCNCVGSKDCDKYDINFNDNFNTSTYIWNINADVLYEGEPGFAWYDCELPNVLQIPTSYTCVNCGANPYESMDVTTPNGDNGTSINPPNCFNPNANNNCECVCGWTFYGAELISHTGAAITLQVTDPLNAQVCFQTDIEGTDATGACCISNCLQLEFEYVCNLDINAQIDCMTYGTYIVSFSVNGALPGSEITNVTINGNTVGFIQNGNIVTTDFVNSAPNSVLLITATDSYDCIAETQISTPCCDFQVDIQPVTCEEYYVETPENCKLCGVTGDSLIVAYNIITYDLPVPYQLYLETNDPVVNTQFSGGPITVNTPTHSVPQLSLYAQCQNLLIYQAYITYNNCTTILVEDGEICSGNCYAGFWTSVGSVISKWNTPNHISYFNYKIQGLQISDGVTPSSILFASYGIPDIDVKAIICQAHKDAGTSSCNQNTYVIVGSGETVVTSTTCYNNPLNCISDNLPSVNLKTYHQNLVTYMRLAWHNRINGTTFGSQVNQALNAIGQPNLVIYPTPLIIPSTSYPTVLLPDSTPADQWHVYRYMVISTQRYPLGTIKLLRNINNATNPSPITITIGCESNDCFTPTAQFRYDCEACTTPVQGGQYATTAECILNCNETYGYNCGDCNELVISGTYATTEECLLICQEDYGYNCGNCDQLVVDGQYTTTEDCDAECPTGLLYWDCSNNCEAALLSGDYQNQLDCLSGCEENCNATITGMLITDEEGGIVEEGNYEYILLDIDNMYPPMLQISNKLRSFSQSIDTSVFKTSKDDIKNSLSHVTNMQTFGYGTKITNNIDTKEPCIVVYVDEKRNVSDDIKVPEYINGYKTDVIKGSKHASAFSTYCAGDCYQTNGNTILYDQPTSCYDGSICWECQMYSNGNCISYIPCNPSGQQDACPSGTCDEEGVYKDRNNHCNSLENRDNLFVTTPGVNQGSIKLQGGTSGAGANINCTFGIVARDNTQNGKLVGLVNNHCFKCSHYSSLSESIISNPYVEYTQTSSTDYNYNNVNNTRIQRQVGTFNRDYPVMPTDNLVDCAVFDLLFPNYIPDGSYLYYDFPDTGVFNIGNGPYEWMTENEVNTAVLEHWAVLKSGRTTGVIDQSTLSIVDDLIVGEFTVEAKIASINVNGCYCSETQSGSYDCLGTVPEFLDVIQIKNHCNEGRYIGAPGDSSSPVLTVNPNTGEIKLLGLLFAGSCGNIYVIPMYNIASELDVSYWDGTIIVHTNGEEYIQIDGKNYQKGNPTNEHVTHILDN